MCSSFAVVRTDRLILRRERLEDEAAEEGDADKKGHGGEQHQRQVLAQR